MGYDELVEQAFMCLARARAAETLSLADALTHAAVQLQRAAAAVEGPPAPALGTLESKQADEEPRQTREGQGERKDQHCYAPSDLTKKVILWPMLYGPDQPKAARRPSSGACSCMMPWR
jgi:hypothetical protein